ncbi:hypothetical protein D3C81_2091470 [compost metagenome]
MQATGRHFGSVAQGRIQLTRYQRPDHILPWIRTLECLNQSNTNSLSVPKLCRLDGRIGTKTPGIEGNLERLRIAFAQIGDHAFH